MNRMSFPLLREAAPTFTWVVLALSLSACSKSATETCSSGLVCPEGWSCTADGQDCIEGHCGDGITQEGEACDDGNTRNGDGCNSTCTSNELCGNGVRDPGEACDDGNTVSGDDCSADCLHSAECGNGTIDKNEECDPPGDRDGYRCSKNCKIAFCGNGKIDEGEACDDGNTLTACPYGTKDCTACSADCTAELTIHGAYCGDGHLDPGEVCDDGPANGTKRCQYGLKSCTVCNADCSGQEDGKGSYCGDGTKDEPFEVCDLGSNACGTCSARCTRIQLSPATGHITVTDITKIQDDDVLVISDGVNFPLTIRFSSDCNWGPPSVCKQDNNQPRCCIRLHNNEEGSDLASAIKGAILEVNPDPDHSSLLNVSATIDSPPSTVIQLTHGAKATWGNQSLKTNNTNALHVEGLYGGVGHDCPENSQCDSDDDCAFGLTCKEDKDHPKDPKHCR